MTLLDPTDQNAFRESSLLDLPDTAVLELSLEKPDAFAGLVDRYERAFLRKAMSIVGNEEDAYDVVQETFVRIYAAGKRFKKQKGASFSSWAYKILVNRCYTLYRKNKKRDSKTARLDWEPAFLAITPDQTEMDAYESKLSKDYLLSLMSKLPTLLKRTLRLYAIEGLAQKEIAAIEGVGNGVIRARIYRAKKELRKMSLSLA